jgi:hypothetical protein
MAAARVISIGDFGGACFGGIFSVIISLNHGFKGLTGFH